MIFLKKNNAIEIYPRDGIFYKNISAFLRKSLKSSPARHYKNFVKKILQFIFRYDEDWRKLDRPY